MFNNVFYISNKTPLQRAYETKKGRISLRQKAAFCGKRQEMRRFCDAPLFAADQPPPCFVADYADSQHTFLDDCTLENVSFSTQHTSQPPHALPNEKLVWASVFCCDAAATQTQNAKIDSITQTDAARKECKPSQTKSTFLAVQAFFSSKSHCTRIAVQHAAKTRNLLVPGYVVLTALIGTQLCVFVADGAVYLSEVASIGADDDCVSELYLIGKVPGGVECGCRISDRFCNEAASLFQAHFVLCVNKIFRVVRVAPKEATVEVLFAAELAALVAEAESSATIAACNWFGHVDSRQNDAEMLQSWIFFSVKNTEESASSPGIVPLRLCAQFCTQKQRLLLRVEEQPAITCLSRDCDRASMIVRVSAAASSKTTANLWVLLHGSVSADQPPASTLCVFALEASSGGSFKWRSIHVESFLPAAAVADLRVMTPMCSRLLLQTNAIVFFRLPTRKTAENDEEISEKTSQSSAEAPILAFLDAHWPPPPKGVLFKSHFFAQKLADLVATKAEKAPDESCVKFPPPDASTVRRLLQQSSQPAVIRYAFVAYLLLECDACSASSEGAKLLEASAILPLNFVRLVRAYFALDAAHYETAAHLLADANVIADWDAEIVACFLRGNRADLAYRYFCFSGQTLDDVEAMLRLLVAAGRPIDALLVSRAASSAKSAAEWARSFAACVVEHLPATHVVCLGSMCFSASELDAFEAAFEASRGCAALQASRIEAIAAALLQSVCAAAQPHAFVAKFAARLSAGARLHAAVAAAYGARVPRESVIFVAPSPASLTPAAALTRLHFLDAEKAKMRGAAAGGMLCVTPTVRRACNPHRNDAFFTVRATSPSSSSSVPRFYDAAVGAANVRRMHAASPTAQKSFIEQNSASQKGTSPNAAALYAIRPDNRNKPAVSSSLALQPLGSSDSSSMETLNAATISAPQTPVKGAVYAVDDDVLDAATRDASFLAEFRRDTQQTVEAPSIEAKIRRSPKRKASSKGKSSAQSAAVTSKRASPRRTTPLRIGKPAAASSSAKSLFLRKLHDE